MTAIMSRQTFGTFSEQGLDTHGLQLAVNLRPSPGGSPTGPSFTSLRSGPLHRFQSPRAVDPARLVERRWSSLSPSPPPPTLFSP